MSDPDHDTAALRFLKAQHRLLVEEIGDFAIFSTDLDSKCLTWNPGVHHVLGFEESEFLGTDVRSQIFTPEDIAAGIPDAELSQAAAQGTANDDRWMRRKDGTRFFATGVTTRLEDESGTHIGFTKIMRDHTGAKLLEEQLEAAHRRKDELLAMLAHELRNPLAPILNSVHILQLIGPADPRLHEQLSLILRQTKHLKRLLDDLLDITRFTRGSMQLDRAPLELQSILMHAVEMSQPLIDGKHQLIQVSLPARPIRMEGDATRLTQIFNNLLNNAAKYSPEGGHISLAAVDEGTHARILVKDDGIGMDEDLLRRAFDIFVQQDPRHRRSGGGLGLGLTLVKRLVELHAGEVHARSDGPGRGTEIEVKLPLVIAGGSPPG